MKNIIFEKPIKSGYTVYAKSGCIYCENAKLLLKNCHSKKIINSDEYLKNNRGEFMAFIKSIVGKKYELMPVVFHNGVFIGGYTELNARLQKF